MSYHLISFNLALSLPGLQAAVNAENSYATWLFGIFLLTIALAMSSILGFIQDIGTFHYRSGLDSHPEFYLSQALPSGVSIRRRRCIWRISFRFLCLSPSLPLFSTTPSSGNPSSHSLLFNIIQIFTQLSPSETDNICSISSLLSSFSFFILGLKVQLRSGACHGCGYTWSSMLCPNTFAFVAFTLWWDALALSPSTSRSLLANSSPFSFPFITSIIPLLHGIGWDQCLFLLGV